MKYLLKSLSLNSVIVIVQIFIQVFSSANAQTYKADYKSLSAKLLTGDEPIIICILEDVESGNNLYDGLVLNSDIKNKFTIYSTDVLNEYKSILGIEEFNPEDKNFLQALNDALGVEYLLNWKALPGINGGFQLSVYSIKNNKIYDNKFYPSQNSNAVLDVQKLLAENLEPVYTTAVGELEISSKPIEVHYKLYRGSDLIKEWTGNEKQKIEAGKYKLISEAAGYKIDERNIDVLGEQINTVELSLEEDLNILPNISSLDSRLSNIKLNLDRDKLKIFYDLAADKSEEYDIELTLIDKSTKNVTEIKKVSGSNEKVKPGTNKVISWEYISELGKTAQLKNFELKISVEKSGGIAWYTYVGGGAALVGGLAAILIGGGGEDNGNNPPAPQKIGTPPVRPAGD